MAAFLRSVRAVAVMGALSWAGGDFLYLAFFLQDLSGIPTFFLQECNGLR
jgi:hypothetical protein